MTTLVLVLLTVANVGAACVNVHIWRRVRQTNRHLQTLGVPVPDTPSKETP